jgi:hypothetical protein
LVTGWVGFVYGFQVYSFLLSKKYSCFTFVASDSLSILYIFLMLVHIPYVLTPVIFLALHPQALFVQY